MKNIFADYAAATPISKRSKQALVEQLESGFENPSADYLAARKQKQILEELRSTAARAIGASSNEVIFTSGATEAINIALGGVSGQFEDSRIVISGHEHAAVSGWMDDTRVAVIDDEFYGEANSLEDVSLVSLNMVSNETGRIGEHKRVLEKIKQVREQRLNSGNRLPLYLHIDASQAGLYFKLDVNRLGVDLMTINAGKMFGPKQAAILFVKRGTILKPQLKGGGQERGLRSGTEAVHQIAGAVVALTDAQSKIKESMRQVTVLREKFESALEKEFGDKISVVEQDKKRAPHISGVMFDGIDGESLAMKLDELGVSVATGSACANNNDSLSWTLSRQGYSEAEILSFVRFSFSTLTTSEDIDNLLSTVIKALKLLV